VDTLPELRRTPWHDPHPNQIHWPLLREMLPGMQLEVCGEGVKWRQSIQCDFIRCHPT
jgi:hypothetical protein